MRVALFCSGLIVALGSLKTWRCLIDSALNVMILIVAVLVLNFSAAIARRIIAVTMIPVSAMGHRRN